MNDDQRSATENGGVGPLPAEPAPGSAAAVAAAAETIRSLSPEPERPAHKHSFAVDISCECGIMLSAYTNRLATDLAAEAQRNAILRLEVALLKSHLAVETAAKEEAQRQRDGLADALAGVRDYVLKNFETIENEARAHGNTLIWKSFVAKAVDAINAMDSALRAAGRLR